MSSKQLIVSLIALGGMVFGLACGNGSFVESPDNPDNQYNPDPGIDSDREGTRDYPGSEFDGIRSPETDPAYIGTGGTTTSGPATVRFLLTDAPKPEIDSAIVTISDVTVHKTGGAWFSVMDGELTLDLLDLQNGVTELLGEIELEEGKYTGIRLHVLDGEVVSGEDTYDVDVPPGEIKINRPFDVCGGEMEIVIDFDAEKSLRYNPGQDLFKMQPVVKIESVTNECDDEGDDDDEAYDGPLGWVSIVVPPVIVEDFESLSLTVEDIQVHDQGIGQVSTFEEDYDADLLEEDRQVLDEETGDALYTVMVPPVEVPAGTLDQLRLLFSDFVAVDTEGNEVLISLPQDEEGEGQGLKFFGEIEVCEDALTILEWDIDLSAAGLDFDAGEIKIHPETHVFDLIVTCEPVEEEDNGEETADE